MRIISIFGVLIMFLLTNLVYSQETETVEIVLFRDTTFLAFYISSDEALTVIPSIEFRVSINNTSRTYTLSSFADLSTLNSLDIPACIVLRLNNTSDPLPIECQAVQPNSRLITMIAIPSQFWFDSANRQPRLLTITTGEISNLCPSQETECVLVFEVIPSTPSIRQSSTLPTLATAQDYFERAENNKDIARYEAAYEDYLQAIELDPNFAPAYVGRGEMERALGLFNEAFQSFQRAIEIDENLARAYSGLAQVQTMLGNYESAIEYVEHARELDPQAAHSYIVRGEIYISQNNPQAAIAELSDGIEVDPNSFRLYMYRGTVESGLGNIDRAFEDYATSIQLQPLNPMIYVYRATAYMQVGNFVNALQDLQRAISLNDEMAEPYLVMAQIYYFGQGNCPAAYETMLTFFEHAEGQSMQPAEQFFDLLQRQCGS